MQQQKNAIVELCLRYAHCVDRREFPALGELMTSDCILSGPDLHLDGINAIIKGMSVLDGYKTTFHCVHNCLIEIHDGHASGEIYCTASHIYDDEAGVEMKQDWGIRYLDNYIFDKEQWRISKRELAVDWVQQLPTKMPPTS